MISPASIATAAKISLQIDNKELRGFTGLTVTRSVNACADAFSFALPWRATTQNLGLFCPFSLPVVKILVETDLKKETLLSGYLEKETFGVVAEANTLNIEGRSAAGILLDIAAQPYQLDNLTFNQISTAFYKSLDPRARVGIAYAEPDTQTISEVQVNVGDTQFGVLSKIAQALGLYPCPQTNGRLKFQKIDTKKNFATLEQGKGVVRSVSATYDSTKRFQEYLAVGNFVGKQSHATVQDSQNFGLAKRGRSIAENKQETTTIEASAKNLRANALRNSFNVSAVVDGWHYKGELWQPGQLVSLTAPGVYINSPFQLLIQKIDYKLDTSGGQTSTLEFVHPSVYDGSEPKGMPWVS